LLLRFERFFDDRAIMQRIVVQPTIVRRRAQRRRVRADGFGQSARARERIAAIVLGPRVGERLQLSCRGRVMPGDTLGIGATARVSKQPGRRHRVAVPQESLRALVGRQPQPSPAERMRAAAEQRHGDRECRHDRVPPHNHPRRASVAATSSSGNNSQ
jgi:hypothetical protein